MKRYILLLVLTYAMSASVAARITLPALLSDNMVLQQQSRIRVWGWCEPDVEVEISATWGAQEKTIADDEGSFMVTLTTPAASFNTYSITVNDGEPVTINNIFIGEVWLCSGQSNMEMTLSGFGSSGIEDANQAIVESYLYPGIRLFSVARNSSTEPQKDCIGQWDISSPAVVKAFSAVGYFYALQLNSILGVPVGIICSSWGGTSIEAWMDAESQESFADVDLKLLYEEEFPVFDKPISLYNGMLFPVFNYTVRGFLWYQGESNVIRHSTYAGKMEAMIRLWRTQWGNDTLPFFYAEIAPFNYASNKIDLTDAQINAALLREQQAQVMDRVGNVGMVCTNDLVFPYERNEVHPTSKFEIAQRFMYWALRDVYGFGDAISVIGPRFRSVRFEENKAIVTFKDVSGEVCSFGSKDDMAGFEIAGADRVFYPAQAYKEQSFSRELIVSCEEVDQPLAVRYCFRNFQLGNVKNAFGQPMVPFRTDEW